MNGKDLREVEPPDDTGSGTFARFVYQAHVTFVFCLDAVLRDEVESVFAEHIEDVAVRSRRGWRFLQVKTKDPGRGTWSLADLAGKKGALQSLWRAYTTVGEGVDATYECHLEGSLSAGDTIHLLKDAGGRRDARVLALLQKHLGIDAAAADAFAQKVRVFELPLRTSIASENLRVLGRHAPNVTMKTLEAVYGEVVGVIQAVMTADRLGGAWPRAILDASTSASRMRIEAKEISRARARELFGPLWPPQPARTSPPPFVLPQLDVPTFTDRDEQMARLKAALLPDDGAAASMRIAAVGGGPGLGKSALVSHFAEVHRDRFPDGVIGLRVDGRPPLAAARDFLRSAGEVALPDDQRDATTLMQDVFRRRHALLIFDNADEPDVQALLPGGTECAAILTSRDRSIAILLGVPESHRIELPPLREDDALLLLRQLIGVGRVDAEHGAAETIVRLVGGLPLALQIAGAALQLETWRTLSDYAVALEEEEARLPMLAIRGAEARGVRASFSISLRLLDETEVAFYGSIGVCAEEGFSLRGATAAAGCDEAEARQRLRRLYQLSLVNQVESSQRFVLHPLLRVFARELATERSLMELATRRHAEFFLGLVDQIADPRVIAEELVEILSAAERLDSTDAVRKVRVLNRVGFVLLHEGRLETAKSYHERARELAESTDDAVGRAAALAGVAGVREKQYDVVGAIEAYRESVAIAAREGRRGLEAEVSNRYARALFSGGNFAVAEDVYRRSLELYRELNDERGQAEALSGLALTLRQAGKFEEALAVYRQALAFHELLGHDPGTAMAITGVGEVLMHQGRSDEAVDTLRHAVERYERVGDDRNVVFVLHSLGGALRRDGRFDEAADVFERAAIRAAHIGDVRQETIALNSLASALERTGRLNEAVQVHERIASMSEGLADPRATAFSLLGLGDILVRQRRLPEAAEAFRRGHSRAEAAGDIRATATILERLAKVSEGMGNRMEAADLLRRVSHLYVSLNDRVRARGTMERLAATLRKAGRPDEANEALDDLRALGDDAG